MIQKNEIRFGLSECSKVKSGQSVTVVKKLLSFLSYDLRLQAARRDAKPLLIIRYHIDQCCQINFYKVAVGRWLSWVPLRSPPMSTLRLLNIKWEVGVKKKKTEITPTKIVLITEKQP